VLKEHGAILVDVTIRNAGLASPAAAIIRSSEAAAFHEKRMNEHAADFEPQVRETLEAATFYSAVDYVKAMRLRTVLVEEMRRVIELCDIIAHPAWNHAPKLEPPGPPADSAAKPPSSPLPDTFNLANMTGIPAIVQPCGFSNGPPELPVGIQFCAKAFGEATLFQVAQAYESATNWHTRRPKFET
jgi:aspartyl-tRNA(Asn)/glutamyl-tRNA(Gln) amidotransferase subunit A